MKRYSKLVVIVFALGALLLTASAQIQVYARGYGQQQELCPMEMPVIDENSIHLQSGEYLGLSAEEHNPIEKPVKNRNGIRIHTVETEYQDGKQEIHVLLPNDYVTDKKYRVLYVLPVEKDFYQRYGYGLGVLKRMDAHNEHDIIIVQMGFEKEPWYGDHATDLKTRQASYLRKFIVPFIEKHYSTIGTPEGRLLFGFSKSGWGAFSLILTYPNFFGYAASWDAPMFFDIFHYGMEQVYGNQDQLNVYRPDLLVSKHKKYFQEKPRLVLTGEQGWGRSIPTPTGGDHTIEMHKLLNKEGIKHFYDNNLKVPHRWNEKWMEPTLTALMEITKTGPSSMRLWHKVDISTYRGTFVCLGDLTGDRRVDFLLYRQGPGCRQGL